MTFHNISEITPLVPTTAPPEATESPEAPEQPAYKLAQVRLGREAAERLKALSKSQLLIECQLTARTLWAAVPWTHEHLRGDETPSELAALAHDVIHALLRENDALKLEQGRLIGEVQLRDAMIQAKMWQDRQETPPRAMPKLGDPNHPDGPGPHKEAADVQA